MVFGHELKKMLRNDSIPAVDCVFNSFLVIL